MRPLLIALIALPLFLVVPQTASAQTSASLSGVVNQTGAGLPDAAVTIKNLDTAETRTVLTDRAGRYQSSGLPAGSFDIRAAKQGFTDETRAGISLAVGQGATVDIKMQVKAPDVCASGKEFEPPIAR